MPELNNSPDESTETAGTIPASADATGSTAEPGAEAAPAAKTPARKRAPAKKTANKTAKKTASKAAAKPSSEASRDTTTDTTTDAAPDTSTDTGEADTTPPKRRTRKAVAPLAPALSAAESAASRGDATQDADVTAAEGPTPSGSRPAVGRPAVLFQAPDFEAAPLFVPPESPDRSDDSAGGQSRDTRVDVGPETSPDTTSQIETSVDDAPNTDDADDDSDESGPRRRRRRGGRGRRKKGDDAGQPEGADTDTSGTADSSDSSDSSRSADADPDHAGAGTGRRRRSGAAEPADADPATASSDSGDDSDAGTSTDTDSDSASGQADGDGTGSRRRRRRRRRKSEDADDTDETGTGRVRDGREVEDEVTSLKGSTRLEAKKQRRREGREAGRRRPPILSEAEFLARRESVDRVMAVRQTGDLTQIAVLEDDVLVEHYVSQATQQSLIGNVYLGRVQNVLPAMEAAFVDIGRGRNAVIYAGEVDWSDRPKQDGPRRIEDVLKSGQSILVQVTKDPVGHKGARLTSQISLPGRYVVYVPGGSMSGISRKLPDNERTRLKNILKKVVPDDAGVIVRTAAEGASEEELPGDVTRLQREWEAIRAKSNGQGPALLHGEPDLAIKVVRDLFNEDFNRLIVSGDRAWAEIDDYVTHVASSLADRVQKWTGPGDLFADTRIDEQIAKALDRKVWLPSGGSLVIDRTEAMTVIDVNTGKFTGSGGNLEETVTKNNLEAAEEIVRQLRLRDIGGIIVIDFIDMVLEANRDLVLRRLVECLGRDRTKHQVAEVTSLGLVQMTRKRIGTGLIEAFSEPCPHCKGRGLVVHAHPSDSEAKGGSDDTGRSGSRRSPRGKRRRDEDAAAKSAEPPHGPKLDASSVPSHASPADLFAGGHANGGADEASGEQPVEMSGASAGHGEGTTEPTAATPEPAAATPEPADQAAEAAPEETSGRRGRRRARRSAGRPGAETAESTAVAPDAVESDAVESDAGESDAGKPERAEPERAEPERAEPDHAEGERAGAQVVAPISGAGSILDEPPAPATRRGRRRAQRPAGRPEASTPTGADGSTVAARAVGAEDDDAGRSAAVVPVTKVGTAVVETVSRRPRRRVERPAGKPDPHDTDVADTTKAPTSAS